MRWLYFNEGRRRWTLSSWDLGKGRSCEGQSLAGTQEALPPLILLQTGAGAAHLSLLSQAQQQVESVSLRAPPSSPRVPLAPDFTPDERSFKELVSNGEYKSF